MHHPMTQFSEWFAAAQACAEIREPTAMTLATATPNGLPAARIVLLKGHDVQGFVFYGNLHSRKFRELTENPHAALCFYWMPLDKQVRIEGRVESVSDAEADAYFASRGRGKQLGAWASKQSEPMESREDLETRIAEFDRQFAGQNVPRPTHWSGWRLAPTRIEFWQQIEFRLHARDVYTRATTQADWQHTLLYP